MNQVAPLSVSARIPSASAGIQTYQAQVRCWGGASLRTTRLKSAGELCLRAPNTEQPRITALLEDSGGGVECRSKPNVPSQAGYLPRVLAFIPAGDSAWAYSEKGASVRLATLSLDVEQLEEEIDVRQLQAPRLAFTNERVWQLLRILVEECNDPDRFSALYCESLTLALTVEILRLDARSLRRNKPGALGRTQLKDAIETIEARLAERVTLAELAKLAGMSPSHFCHAFKASTGMPPHRWQLHARIRRAQQLLLANTPIAAVAAVTGFADQAHFTRVFRRQLGQAPASWLRETR